MLKEAFLIYFRNNTEIILEIIWTVCRFCISSWLMEAHKEKCLQFCWLSFLYLKKKPGNLKLLPNYSHEQRALLSQIKAPKHSVARLHGAGLSFLLTCTKWLQRGKVETQMWMKCNCCCLRLHHPAGLKADADCRLTNSTSYLFRKHSTDDKG